MLKKEQDVHVSSKLSFIDRKQKHQFRQVTDGKISLKSIAQTCPVFNWLNDLIVLYQLNIIFDINIRTFKAKVIHLIKKHLNDSCYIAKQQDVLLFIKLRNVEYCYDVLYKNTVSLVTHYLYLLFLCIPFLSAFLIFLRNMCSAG